MIVLTGLEKSFDNDKAEDWLNVSIGKVTFTSALLRKSMYDFDLETPDGIERLMALLPIMDPEILKDIMGELWPGYPTDIDARRHRMEIKGYLKDYLESYDQETAATEQAAVPGEATAEAGGPPGQAPAGPEAQAGSSGQAVNAQPEPAQAGAVPPATPAAGGNGGVEMGAGAGA